MLSRSSRGRRGEWKDGNRGERRRDARAGGSVTEIDGWSLSSEKSGSQPVKAGKEGQVSNRWAERESKGGPALPAEVPRNKPVVVSSSWQTYQSCPQVVARAFLDPARAALYRTLHIRFENRALGSNGNPLEPFDPETFDSLFAREEDYIEARPATARPVSSHLSTPRALRWRCSRGLLQWKLRMDRGGGSHDGALRRGDTTVSSPDCRRSLPTVVRRNDSFCSCAVYQRGISAHAQPAGGQ